MRVSITSGATTNHLAGQSGVDEKVHTSATNIRISGNIATQARGGVRKAAAGIYDRKNLTSTVEFETSRLFETPAAAERWCLAYDRTFVRSGTVTMDPMDEGIVQIMTDAVVLPPTRTLQGCTVFLSYTIIGGAITAGT
jgi:hypothetical protein